MRVSYRHIELNGPDNGNGIQIMVFDNEASVTVPYWHVGAKARVTFEELWECLDIMQQEGGYFTYDPQIGRVLDLKSDFILVLNQYERTSGEIQSRFAVLKPKRWWEFWK